MCLDVLYSLLREKEVARARQEAAEKRPKVDYVAHINLWVNIFEDGKVSGTFPTEEKAKFAAANGNVRVVETLKRQVALAA